MRILVAVLVCVLAWFSLGLLGTVIGVKLGSKERNSAFRMGHGLDVELCKGVVWMGPVGLLFGIISVVAYRISRGIGAVLAFLE